MRKGFALPLVIILAIVITVISTLVYWKFRPNPQTLITNHQDQKQSVPQSSASEPNANWKTYINNNLGISLNYPVDWVLTSSGNSYFDVISSKNYKVDNNSGKITTGAALTIPKDSRISVNSFTDAKEGTIASGEDPLPPQKLTNVKKTKLDSSDILKYDFQFLPSGRSGTRVEIKLKDNKVYRFEMDFESGTYKDTLDQIISTFKFL